MHGNEFIIGSIRNKPIWNCKKRHYPNDAFWRIAGETGNRCVIGYDAHNPNDFFGFREAEEIAVLLAQKCGVKICDPLRQTVN